MPKILYVQKLERDAIVEVTEEELNAIRHPEDKIPYVKAIRRINRMALAELERTDPMPQVDHATAYLYSPRPKSINEDAEELFDIG